MLKGNLEKLNFVPKCVAFVQKLHIMVMKRRLTLKENMVENSAEISSKCAVCPQIMSLTPISFGTQSNDIRECVMKF